MVGSADDDVVGRPACLELKLEKSAAAAVGSGGGLSNKCPTSVALGGDPQLLTSLEPESCLLSRSLLLLLPLLALGLFDNGPKQLGESLLSALALPSLIKVGVTEWLPEGC